ncbi:hypothetical protein SAMN05216499_1253 [Actinacidiphila paucisporea]|uniref:Uncharacterized protein n=1 Tax=Actinacidiphila paucisporea TaxID=310782 RepID=A0A1M7PQ36_9ACTN|nr:hypothetical protein SAMN05216499_1253 [Actinacidiphila paucisporea]
MPVTTWILGTACPSGSRGCPGPSATTCWSVSPVSTVPAWSTVRCRTARPASSGSCRSPWRRWRTAAIRDTRLLSSSSTSTRAFPPIRRGDPPPEPLASTAGTGAWRRPSPAVHGWSASETGCGLLLGGCLAARPGAGEGRVMRRVGWHLSLPGMRRSGVQRLADLSLSHLAPAAGPAAGATSADPAPFWSRRRAPWRPGPSRVPDIPASRSPVPEAPDPHRSRSCRTPLEVSQRDVSVSFRHPHGHAARVPRCTRLTPHAEC